MEAKKRNILSTGETKKFIDIWKNYVEDLRMSRKNSHVLKEMQDDLRKQYDISLSPEEIRTRINNLTKKYRYERKKVGPSGGTPSQWELYDELNEFLGSFKSNRVHELTEETIRPDEDPLSTTFEDTLHDGLPSEVEDNFSQTLGQSSSMARLVVSTPLPPPTELSSSSWISGASSSRPVPGPCRTVTSAQQTNKIKKDYATQRFLELAEEEAAIFKTFCAKATANDEKRIELLQENLNIQKAILEQLKNK